MNPAKTEDGKYVTCYSCDPKTVKAEFLLSKKIYEDITGRTQGKNVVMYQIRQSFQPGEITPDEAHKIAYELAMSFTKGKYAFVVSTHTDKAHVHTHIDFNSTSIDCTKKFRDFLGSGKALAKISDRICLENGLSIIETPNRSKKHYGKWLGNKKPLSHSQILKQVIDEILEQKPKDFNMFLSLMQSAGYEIKEGKHIAFKGKEQKKFIRLRSLGEGYLEEDIKAIISGKEPVKRKSTTTAPPKKSINLLVDIQSKLAEGKGVGYERWAKIFNLKQMAQTINYLREHNLIQYEDLEKRATEITTNFEQLNTQIKSAEKRMAEIKVLQTHIYNYAKTRDIYTAYRKAGYSKKFYAEHESDLILHKAAKAHFDKLEVKKLPTIKTLQAEYAELLSTKKQAYGMYKQTKKEMQDILRAKENIDRMLEVEHDKTNKEKSQNER